MTHGDEVLKQEVVEALAGQVRERLGPEEAPSAERFVRLYYEGVPAAEVLSRDPGELLGSALALWSFGRERQPGRAAVRAYNPDSAEDGWESPHTVVEMVNDDMPFLVDSVNMELSGRGLAIHLLVHPIVRVRRDESGTLSTLAGGDAGEGDAEAATPESFIQVEVDRLDAEGELREIEEALRAVLVAVRAAVEDWQPMRERLGALRRELAERPPELPEEEVREAREFLRWLEADHFTFLGYREAGFFQRDGKDFLTPDPETGLGVLRESFREGRARPREVPPVIGNYARRREVLVVTKSDRRSVIHRPVHMDYIGVKRYDEAGVVVGERRFLGLFTSLAYNRRLADVPLLRRKVRAVLDRAGFDPASHDGKALVHVLETFPRDELFQISPDELYSTALGILRLQERRRLAVFVREDTFQRFVSCLVFVPRERYDTDLRLRMEKILEQALGGEMATHYIQIGDDPLARIHFIVQTRPGEIPEYDTRSIEAALDATARTWSEDLARVLVERRGEGEGKALARRYGEAFPVAYRESFPPEDARHDIERLEQALGRDELGMSLYRPLGARPADLRFKLYSSGQLAPLSEVVPLLEDMGLRVIAERPYRVTPVGVGRQVWVRDFTLVATHGGVDLHQTRERYQEAFARVWRGELESDPHNRLVLRAGLAWRQVALLRAYNKYLRQTGITFSRNYMALTLVRYPQVASKLVELFEARFDPDRDPEERRRRSAELEAELSEALEGVEKLDEDRILGRFINLVDSTLRTNYFQVTPEGGPKPYLALKLDSRRVAELPDPRPAVEIFVYSPRVEAVHLRGGPVARGGIRWSDRRQDFRTEILGLMKAQMVKNAVIVPVGAKGGFVVKEPPTEREAFLREGVECYKTMIRGLLDLTDNSLGGKVEPPPRVVRLDGDDTYLVVAADKGTATFSDVANGVAAEYGFWLGDAFASGGSAGYDHKKMGITARGAWEAVKRHFRELGKDIRREEFTAVGVGDMSGDVFGNGMLLSPATRLVGAFNHRQIFVDPDPDPAASFAERRRLFELPGSAWTDYDRDRISPGGGVFDRGAKAVPVSPEMAALLGLPEGETSPNTLVRALLTAPVELLWFGGIGTFVRASGESDSQAGDRANDPVRVAARELRTKVIGEGANLGLTQRGRIEFALGGGKLNTDAVDNSGGVDCSDHEVNIKILLNGTAAARELSPEQRDTLLREMTDEVAELVLRHNYLQTQAISVAEAEGAEALDDQARLVRELERAGRLDPELEALPDGEGFAERSAAGRGLTRPELAVLLAYSKISLFQDLIASDLPDDPHLEGDLLLYFPQPLRQRFAQGIRGHHLRREIVATYVTNSLVNRVGPTFFSRMARATGRTAPEIARAYILAREAFGLREVWSAIEARDNRVAADVQLRMILEVERLAERATRWLLRRSSLDLASCLARFQPGVAVLNEGLEDLLPASDLAALRRRRKRLENRAVPPNLAYHIAGLPAMASALDIVALAEDTGRPVEHVGRTYFLLGARLGLDWLRAAAGRLPAETPWQRAASQALADELFDHQGRLSAQVLTAAPAGSGARAALDAWTGARQSAYRRTRELLSDLKSAGSVDHSMLAVASHQLRELAAGEPAVESSD